MNENQDTELRSARRATLTNPPAPTVWPSIGFTDTEAAVAFLEGLGFVVTALYRDDDGTVAHAEARWPDGGGVMFGTRGTRGKPNEWAALGPQGCYVVAAEPATVDAAFAAVRELDGVEVRGTPSETDYGSYQFEVRDGDGNLWSIGTYRGE